MDNKAICDRRAPFMVRRQDTGNCAVLMVGIGDDGILNEASSQPKTYTYLVSHIEQLFFPGTTGHYGRELGRKITKLEARWLPRGGHESEGYPHTLFA